MCSYRLNDIANSITAATYDVIAQGKVKTPDLGGERRLSVSDLPCIHTKPANLCIG